MFSHSHATSKLPGFVGWRRSLSLVLLTAFLSSCFQWQAQGPTPEAAIKKAAPSTIRITRTDRSKLTLRNPVVARDSIVGQPVSSTPTTTTARVAVPLTQVATVSTRTFDGLKTFGAVIATGAIAILGLCMVEDCMYLFHEDPS